MSIGTRIKEARSLQGYSRPYLAQLVGVTESAISNYENGISSPKEPVMIKLLLALCVDANYLFQDEMAEAREKTKTPALTLVKTEVFKSEHIPLKEAHDVPVLGKIAAGYGLMATEAILDYEPTDYIYYERCFYLKVTGDSMEPKIFENDLVLIDKEIPIESGDIAAVMIDGDGETLKRYVIGENSISLQPLNSNYETKVFIGKERKKVLIVGRVMEIKRKI